MEWLLQHLEHEFGLRHRNRVDTHETASARPISSCCRRRACRSCSLIRPLQTATSIASRKSSSPGAGTATAPEALQALPPLPSAWLGDLGVTLVTLVAL